VKTPLLCRTVYPGGGPALLGWWTALGRWDGRAGRLPATPCWCVRGVPHLSAYFLKHRITYNRVMSQIRNLWMVPFISLTVNNRALFHLVFGTGNVLRLVPVLPYRIWQCFGSGMFVYPGSRIRNFSIPDPNCFRPGSGSATLVYYTVLNWGNRYRKLRVRCMFTNINPSNLRTCTKVDIAYRDLLFRE
jgi:hypothetical protein